ncbi:hypothetical protein A3A21_02345 [Candidatus Jorgensenbacteria bacterium RIFCSPLOWO2_01_FULL_45_25b]|uniref:Uncharacterized protein n=1 Tax=Candidatus Jorgensenbacteria bacterium RIFCSPLOWO2_01_FULL_45_25b TaxID=1798471 RepID=A0A1F6BS71_9BACT|nr:MAG: hypothetical protein A3A21_02345 [Candidatus Jorgensenbacteria bacterium RIFCSPLOWO2_01_FULL_45_25b]
MKKGSNVVIVLVVIVLIAGLGYWYMQRNKAQETGTLPEEGVPADSGLPVTDAEVPIVDAPVAP